MSTVAIVVDSVDETADVIFDRSSFSTSMNGVAGSFDITIRDPNRTKSFSTGKEINLEIDGVLQFGGFVTQVSMIHLAPAADTSDLATYDLRAWNLRGVDYNILFDKRVWRNTADYLSFITLSSSQDGPQIIEAITSYADMTGFSTSGVSSTASTVVPYVLQQGDKLRTFFETMSFFGGTIWYIRGDKTIVYVPFEVATKSWGFSDDPSGSLIGFRQVEAIEDGSYIVNDALIWGGSEFAGSGGGTVFSRTQDATSQSTYSRWQYAETHFGETGYKTSAGVSARSDVIVNGPPGADVYGQQKGLRYPQWQFTFTWFGVDVPGRDHLVAGEIVEIDMTVFGVDKVLPLRTLRISFPDAFEADGSHLVQFDGTFGLQLSDPFTLWAYLLRQQTKIDSGGQLSPAAVTDTSTVAVYGGQYQGVPTPATDGVTVVFTLPFGYIAGTTEVFLNGLIQRVGIDYTETDNVAGTITMSSAPIATDNLLVRAETLGS